MKKILILFFITCLNIFAGNKIVSSNQISYTLASRLIENTNVELVSAFDAYTDMFKQKKSFENLENKDEIFKDVDAVITMSNLLEGDFLYEQARRYNIFVVEIDLTYSYKDNSSLVFVKKFDDNSKIMDYSWLDFSNIYKMIEILTNDLSEIFPENKEIFLKNSNNLRIEIENKYIKFMDKINDNNTDIALVVLGDSELTYLLDSLELYNENIELNPSLEILQKTLNEVGTKKVVFSKTPSKNTLKNLSNLGVSYVKLNNASIPNDLDDDEEMDKNGFIDILDENLTKLEKLLLEKR